MLNQKGVVPILILVAAIGLISFLLVSNTFNFKDTLFNALFPKPASEASQEDKVKKVKDLTLSALKENRGGQKGQVVSTIQERKQTMLILMQEDPAEALRIAIPKKIKDQMPPEVQGDIEDEVTLEGKLEVLHADNFEQQTSKNYFSLVTENNERISLHFADEEPEPRGEIQVRIKGVKLGENIAIESSKNDLQVLEDKSKVLGTQTTKKVAVILFNFQDDTSQPVTADQVRGPIFTNPNSASAYLREASFGKLTIEGDVFGWYTIGLKGSTCDAYAWAVAARNVASAARVNLTGYTNFIYMFPKANNCGWDGFGILYGSEVWINTSQPYLEAATSHELGHNFGMTHSGTYNCKDSSGQRVSISNSCELDQYGDPFDVMGAPYGDGYRHMNNYHKGELPIPNWFDTNNRQLVTTSGTYTIWPIEYASSGIQSLQIKRSDSAETYYYIEYRQPFGFDKFISSDPVVNGVSIRLAPDYAILAHSWLIDTTPFTPTYIDAPLLVGQTFIDPIANITFKTIGVDAQKATVQVTLGSPFCTRANPTVAISPLGQWGNPGQTLSYNITVTNNDSPTCSSSTFNIVPTLPAGLTQSQNSFSLTIPPATQASGTLSISSSSSSSSTGSTEGFYTFTEVATNTGAPSYSGSATANYNVLSSATCPAGLVSYWNMDETSGTAVAASFGGSGNNGTFQGSTLPITPGKLGAAARSFDGTSNYVAFPIGVPSTNGSISFWIKPNAWGSYMAAAGVNGNDFIMYVDPFYAIYGFFSNDTNYQFQTGSSGVPAIGTWSHVVLIWSSTGSKLYINGAQVGTGPVSPSYGGANLLLGRKVEQSVFFNGAIDEVGIWNLALSPTEIAKVYNSGSGLSCSAVTTPTLGNITGTVSSSLGGVVSGATLTLTVNGSIKTYITTTSGGYTVSSIPAGTYLVKFQASGFISQDVTVTVSGSTVVKNVTLVKSR